jgi:hypothetical protein
MVIVGRSIITLSRRTPARPYLGLHVAKLHRQASLQRLQRQPPLHRAKHAFDKAATPWQVKAWPQPQEPNSTEDTPTGCC